METLETDNNPLVSIIVITYNSAKYVLETLESAKAQTYKNIELIVSDDGSTDETIDLCKKWLDENKNEFINTELITVEKNTGIPSNCNRGLKASHGEWIKYIAGDDLLSIDCIEKNLTYSIQNNSKVLFSIRIEFSGNFANKKIIRVSKPSIFNNKNLSAKDQYKLTLRGIGCPPNTMFFKKDALLKVGGFDESFPLIEDWPMNMRITNAGIKIDYMDEETFYYRNHDQSVFNKYLGKKIYPTWYFESFHAVWLKYVRPNIRWDERIAYWYAHLIALIFYRSHLNNYNILNRTLNYLLTLPVKWHRKYTLARITKQILKSKNQQY
jgi:alpha-1,3-rhamnosyltransferase